MKRIAVLASIAAVLLSLVAVARADELKVLSAGTMHFALKDVGEIFTGKNWHAARDYLQRCRQRED